MLARIIALVPKIGPLKALSLRMPTPQAEAMFQDSFNKALDQYQHLLDDQKAGHLSLRDRNFDTGAPTKAGAYFMADRAYARLVDDLAKEHFNGLRSGASSISGGNSASMSMPMPALGGRPSRGARPGRPPGRRRSR